MIFLFEIYPQKWPNRMSISVFANMPSNANFNLVGTARALELFSACWWSDTCGLSWTKKNDGAFHSGRVRCPICRIAHIFRK